MHTRSEHSLAVLLLSQRLVDAEADPFKAAEVWSLLEVVPDPGRLLESSPELMAAEAGVSLELATRLRARFDGASDFAAALESADESGMRVIGPLDDSYPARFRARLGRSAPPILYVVGDVNLLRGDALGVVGSRDVSEEGSHVAMSAARCAVRAGWRVVSGGAKGVDRLAMGAALSAEGAVIGVLADSLQRTVRDAEVRRAISDSQLCLMTPYKPTSGFSVANAMGRNKLIYALSTATLVVASDLESGGTWAGAVESMKHGFAPVLTWTGSGAGSGNGRLVELGALPIDDVGALISTSESAVEDCTDVSQLRLDV